MSWWSGLGSAVGSFLGSSAGSIASAGLGFLSSAQQYNYTKKLMNLQNDLQKEFYKWSYSKSPSLQRAGLESAGYNPILAVQNGVSNASFNQGLGTVGQSDLAGAATNAYQAFQLARKKNNAEVNATNASASLATEQAKTEEFRRQMMSSQTFLNNINTELGKKSLSWYDRRQLQELKSMYINSQANMLGARAAMNQAHSAKMSAQASSDYHNSLRDLNILEQKIKSPKAKAAIEVPQGFANWNYMGRTIFGRN